MVVHEISDDSAMSEFLTRNASKLVVVDFYADWCAPCRQIGPFVEALSGKYSGQVAFARVNVDNCRDVASHYAVNAMPSFVYIQNGEEVYRVVGADPRGIEGKIIEYLERDAAGPATTATSDERNFLQKFAMYAERMLMYEDDVSQTLARSLIPYEKFEQMSTKDGSLEHYQLLRLLLHWFKSEFFTWVDTPKCELCGQNAEKVTRSAGTPSEEEKRDGADRVELYRCSACDTEVRFPRYTEPNKLLETRRGRCGEWASCFTLCCRALGLETRWVWELNDHVWCEVWISELDRWVHCDPCEDVIDTPLLYEKGWGKQLSYVLAFGVDHMRDVTWRYASDHLNVLERRTLCREDVLRSFITALNNRFESLMLEDRKKELQRRVIKELVEFLSPCMQLRGSSAQSQGRVTGSEDWKAARGECGNKGEMVLRPSEKELADGMFSLEYNCAKDEYKRGDQAIRGWDSFASKARNIRRLEDDAEGVAYLCREDGEVSGELCWSFDFGRAHVKNIEFRLDGIKKREDGEVMAMICCGDMCRKVPESGELEVETLEGSRMDVKVSFSGGTGPTPWHQAQLFRTALRSEDCCFRVKAYFA